MSCGGPTAAEMLRIQSDVQAIVCDKPCVIQRATTTPDAYGTSTETWNTISPDNLKAGLSEPTAGQLQNYDYKVGSLATSQVKLPVGTNVAHEDRIIIEGQTLIVQAILTPRSYASLLTVLASEVK
jgi:hypothetical protein